MEGSDFSSPVIPNINRDIRRAWSKTKLVNRTQWVCEYADDILYALREAELKRKLIRFRTTQLEYRPMLLHLLKETSQRFDLTRITLHLATYLMDCFMDDYVVDIDQLNLLAITCLIIAGKMEETDMNMPKFQHFNKFLNNAYTLSDFRNVECRVLTNADFSLIRPTVATFVEYFALNIVTLDEYHWYMQEWYSGRMFSNMEPLDKVLPFYKSYDEMVLNSISLLDEMVDASTNSLKLFNTRPSMVAAACMAAVRRIHCIPIIWTPYLIEITQYTEDVISPCEEMVLSIYRLAIFENELSIQRSQAERRLLQLPAETAEINNSEFERGNIASADRNSSIYEFFNENMNGTGNENNDHNNNHNFDSSVPEKRRKIS